VEGFKSNPKMKSDIACYKEGGSVYKSRTHKDDPKEAAEDKAMVKKGIRQHETAKHKGEEKTEIKLKNGGRSKKEGGNVRKYKAGGAIAMKKGKDDKKAIAQTKKTKPGKADAPSAATGKKKESPKTDNKPAKSTMTASMVGALPEAANAPSAALSMPEDQPIEMMAAGGTPGMGGASDYEQALMQQGGMGTTADAERLLAEEMMRKQRMRRNVPSGAAMGPIGQQALQGAGMGGGMGAAASAGPMGAAAPMGASADLMRGLQAVGQYASGGSTC
jgi:hypothetical protein